MILDGKRPIVGGERGTAYVDKKLDADATFIANRAKRTNVRHGIAGNQKAEFR